MPVSLDTAARLVVRRDAIRRMDAFGFTDKFIGKVLGQDISNDRRHLKEEGHERPVREQPLGYADKFRLWCELLHGGQISTILSDLDPGVSNALEEELKIAQVRQELRGVARGISCMCFPVIPPHLERYFTAAEAIVGKRFPFVDFDVQHLSHFCVEFAQSTVPLVDEDDLVRQISLRMANEAERDMRLIIGDELAEYLEAMMQEVTAVDEASALDIEAFRLYHLQGKTYEEIRRNFDVTDSRVHQRLEKAARRLHHAKGYRRLRVMMDPINRTAAARLAEFEMAHKLREATEAIANLLAEKTALLRAAGEEIGDPSSLMPSSHLSKRMDELHLSCRTRNCLQNAEIDFIWQLVEKTEDQMLEIKNFGPKSLNELKEVLHELGGLHFGMKKQGPPR